MQKRCTAHSECVAKDKDVDKKYNGIDFDIAGPGPVLRRLQSYGHVEGLVIARNTWRTIINAW